MDNQLQVFTHGAFGQVRTLQKDGEVWFVAKDVADILAFRDAFNMLRNIDEDDTQKVSITDDLGRLQSTSIINESGLYSAILRSRKPEAKQFKKWVTSEVLPSIRKHGGYIAGQNTLSI
ncbi:BRO-N domain-containing protein [Anoxybacillus sp. D401a]|uniref:BRO-N domain-containing protein n=1 Tax=Anoxybacillus sp. D401a TaxID=575112 RepID=UPI003D35CA41